MAVLFFTLMLVISFINIKMWFSLSYLFYGVTLLYYCGHLYMVLQPQVLKDGLIYTL